MYACEMNATMVTMSHDILAANRMTDNVAMIHKMSTEMTIPRDLPERLIPLHVYIIMIYEGLRTRVI